MKFQILSENCSGPNRSCRKAHFAGRSVHAIPSFRRDEPALVLPSNHFNDVEEARSEIAKAAASAPTVYADADLYEYRERGIAFFLPVGWVDPSLRRD